MHQDGSDQADKNGDSHPRVEQWLTAAEADADRRGLPELKAVLRVFARATVALRSADWNSPDE